MGVTVHFSDLADVDVLCPECGRKSYNIYDIKLKFSKDGLVLSLHCGMCGKSFKYKFKSVVEEKK